MHIVTTLSWKASLARPLILQLFALLRLLLVLLQTQLLEKHIPCIENRAVAAGSGSLEVKKLGNVARLDFRLRHHIRQLTSKGGLSYTW